MDTTLGPTIHWGYGVPEDVDAFRLFKLLLLHPDDLEPGLWKHFLARTQLSSAEREQMRIVVSLPASWPDTILATMKDILVQAGIIGSRHGHNLQFVREPQAAALAMIYDAEVSGFLKAGDIVIVCDCGGATIDCITQQVISISPLRMRDIVPCEGRFSRIAMMESGFIELLKEKMAGIPGIRGAADIPGVELQQMAEKVWQKKIVKNFTGTEKYNVEIPRVLLCGQQDERADSESEAKGEPYLHFMFRN
ncbi:hypothetical protein SAPIO_CDS3391 [Scedosporium apiospermum]|uniref:Actin-like ATPase domain-containing protein n=1 Tax=Pseudallescheria apiosperma TaxID=563466 RepID=A0A084GAN9_PSEDA|nr:uncharacterized protein SAPIO_CDS3391 [Scedosporium apiospermum]KEZ44401.1 hypothetical protein SAPIO_CDS3391 [Scedosporium apiospermum]